ncbi:MAG: ABC transporter ATP-binding protein [Kiloniellales bacterium]|nr:ABC transporter ATP-binding protein [Kiloniellales bacterium]
MLTVDALSSHYGSVQVLRDFSLALAPGEVLGLLGRNGAGKTTALKTILGLVRASGGSVRLDDTELTALPAHRIPALGLAYVPQGRRLFGELSVEENLRLGLMVKDKDRETLKRILDLFPILRERLTQRAGSLSGGEQQMLATARALCLEPKVLLMDEPTEGLQPSMVATILETVRVLKTRGVAVLLVEQKVEAALAVADRIAFVENGTVLETATPAALHADPAPLYRYVGVGQEAAG